MFTDILKLYIMAPWRFLGNLIKVGEAQYIAAHMSLTTQSVKNWTRQPNLECDRASGRRSFLHYLFLLFDYFYEVDESPERVHQLAEYISVRAGGTFIALPEEIDQPDAEVLMSISDILKKTGESLDVTREAWLEKSPGEFTQLEKQAAMKQHLEAVRAHVRMIKLIDRL